MAHALLAHGPFARPPTLPMCPQPRVGRGSARFLRRTSGVFQHSRHPTGLRRCISISVPVFGAVDEWTATNCCAVPAEDVASDGSNARWHRPPRGSRIAAKLHGGHPVPSSGTLEGGFHANPIVIPRNRRRHSHGATGRAPEADRDHAVRPRHTCARLYRRRSPFQRRDQRRQ